MATRIETLGRAPGAGEKVLSRPAQEDASAAVPRPGVHRLRRVHRPGQLRHQYRRRLAVRLHAGLGDRRRQPDGDADPDAVGEARDRHRSQPAGALPRALLPPHARSASGSRPRRSRWPPISPSSSVPRSASTCCSGWTSSRPRSITGITAFAILGLQRFGFRPLEAIIAGMVAAIGGCYLAELFYARPALHHRRHARGAAAVLGQRVAAARRRHPRRHRYAARDLPPLRR